MTLGDGEEAIISASITVRTCRTGYKKYMIRDVGTDERWEL